MLPFVMFVFHRLQVLDEDKLGRNNFIGETFVPLKVFHSKPSQSLKRSLVSRSCVSANCFFSFFDNPKEVLLREFAGLFGLCSCHCNQHCMYMFVTFESRFW